MRKNQKISRNYVVFNRWSNKRYAVFNSLKRVVRIGTLSVAYLLFANTDKLVAQTPQNLSEIRNYDLEAVDVSAEQQPDVYSALSRVVVTITRAEIERAAVSSIHELLEYASNIDVRHRGGNGMQSDVSIRGGSFDQVLVLLNGINITDPQTGHHNLNLPVDLSSVERIEVLKGPGAWKFGPGAFSGAINIITLEQNTAYLNLAAQGGMYGFNSQELTTGIAAGNTNHLFSFNRKSSDAYVENTDFDYLNLFYHGKFKTKTGHFKLQGGMSDRAFGANSFYTAMYPNQYEEIQTYFASANYKAQLKHARFESVLYFRKNNDRFLLFRDEPHLYANYHTSNVHGANVYASTTVIKNGILSLGAGMRNETIYSNNLGMPFIHERYSSVNDTVLLDKYHSRTLYSFFIGHRHYINRLTINAGVNFTHNNDMPHRWYLFPGIDLNYRIKNYSTIQASLNKTMRMPTFTDMYYSGPNNQGNINLLPEEAVGLEIGYKFGIPEMDFSLTGFAMQGNNMIDWVRESTDEKWRTLNYARLNTQGIEASLILNLHQIFDGTKFFQTLRINYTTINIDKEETGLISNYSLNYLKNRLDVNFRHRVYKQISAAWHVAYQHRNGMYEKIENRVSQGMVEFSPFVKSDFRISWEDYGWNVHASVNNIFDVEYFDIGNVPQPGRWIKVGIAKKIDFR